MPDKKAVFSPENLLDQLKIINGIKFTHREIDIIAFLICGRAVKKIAAFFSIAPKTVENHTHNIMIKLGCNSREGIIDFIEKSDRALILRKHYTTLLAQASFKKSLNEIAQLMQGKEYTCVLTYWEEEGSSPLMNQLENSLKLAKIDVLVMPRNSSQTLESIRDGNNVIYILPKNHEECALNNQEKGLLSKYSSRILFFPKQREPIEIFNDAERDDALDYVTNKSYYYLTFKILKQLFSDSNVEKVITGFEKQFEVIKLAVEQSNAPLILKEASPKEATLNDQKTVFLKSNLLSPLFLFLILVTFIVVCFEFKRKNDTSIFAQNSLHQKIQKRVERSEIRSDLVIPTSTALLERPNLIALIDERFNGWMGIQAIALVGIGGAGKTTLARQYARQQKTNVIWEVNAETKETLSESFEDLADQLSKTDEDKRILMGIIKLKDATKREGKIIQFVKERLRTYQNWLLIYDNVEKFADIQNHFPKDPGCWGQGRVILTTQDNNIENNKYVNNTIVINELGTEEKLSLFIKIMNAGGSSSFVNLQNNESKKFLSAIPPFPLDISVAAYYLKATNTPYQSYLDKMHKYDHNFSNAQERILQEAGDDYTKTRYQIITVSLKHLIDKEQNFKELLFFTCLLDPQNITRDLLLKCKEENIVDEFIHYLKKYSLIVSKNMGSDNSSSFFTMHRSTQNIILTYLTNILKLNEDKLLVRSLASILERDMRDATEKEDFAKMKFLLRHAEHFIGQSDFLNNPGKASLSGELGCMYYYLCHYPRAQELLNLSISELNKNLTEHNAKVAHFLVYLGNIHRRLGDYEKSKQLFEKGIALYKKSSKFHTGMARAYGYLGITHQSLGDFEKAKALLEKSLMIHQKSSKNPIGHAWSLAHLGSVYKNIGDYLTAKNLYEESLQIYKSSSPYHVGVAWVCKDLGFIYAKLGNTERAKHLLEESLAIYRKHFFEDHIYIANALINLGIFYRETKDFEKAKNLLKKGLVVIEKTYGKVHADTGFVLKEIGRTFLAEGNLKIAEDTMNQAHSLFTEIKHPGGYEVLEILAEIYQKKSFAMSNKEKIPESMRLKAQAKLYLVEALKIAKTYFPDDSPHSTRIQSKLNK